MKKQLLIAMFTANTLAGNAQIKINEFMTGGNDEAKEEFVELYNPSKTPVNMLGWHILYKSSSGKNETELLTFKDEYVLLPGEFYLAGSEEFVGKKNGKLKDNLSGTSGAIGLRNEKGELVESVAYGKVSIDNTFIEKSPCDAPAKGTSISRLPDGKDTDDNSLDFVSTKVATPGESNKPVISSTIENDHEKEFEFIKIDGETYSIIFQNAVSQNEVVVFDISGKVWLAEKSGSQKQIDFSSSPAGLYLVNITTPRGKITKKVLID